MAANLSAPTFEKLCRPLARTLSEELARALVDLRADADTQQRYEELATRHTAGELSEADAEELASLVRANTVLGVLKAEAMRRLQNQAAA
jgi:hypothetical protein